MIEIKLAEKETEIESIRTFRNSLLLNHGQFKNDSILKILDPLDSESWILYSLENKRLTGTLRTSSLKNFNYEDFLFQKEFEIHKWLEILPAKEISYTDKLMIGFSLRKKRTLIDLLKHHHKHLLEKNIKADLICPEESKQAFYEWIGYRKFAASFYKETHSSWPLVPMVFLPEDTNYLKEIKSPLAKVSNSQSKTEENYLKKIKSTFYESFKEHTAYIQLRPLAREYGLFFKHPNMKAFIGALKNRKYLSGEFVFKAEELGCSLHLIIKGTAKIAENPSEKYGTGAFLSLDALLSPSIRTYSLIAEEELETLELSSEDFYSIIKSKPKSAALILNLIGERIRGMR